MKRILVLILIVYANTGYAQDCDCQEIFDWTKQTFEENDAGFSYIIEQKGEQGYSVHNAIIQAKVAKTTYAF